MTDGRALKLSVYFGERMRAGGRLAADALLDAFGAHGTAVSILLRGAQGFGGRHALRTDRLLTLSEDLPLVAVAVDAPERVQALYPRVKALVDGGLVTVEQARFGGGGPGGADTNEPAGGQGTLARDAGAAADARVPAAGEQLKLTAYLGRRERAGGQPAFVAACRMLYERGVAGATVLLGVDGTRHGCRQRARFFATNAQVPTMLLAVGEGPEILGALAELQASLPGALFTVERVAVCKRDGLLLQSPDRAGQTLPGETRPVAEPEQSAVRAERPAPETEPGALQKLTAITSEAATHDGHAVHLELVRRLRAAGGAGATSLRGIWGFHGSHAPHGDKLLSIRRHVPVVTVWIDAPERIAALFPLVDELTRERGLVTTESVPANIPL